MSEKARILVIDDDPNVCELVSLYLEKEGFEVHRAGDGQEGLAAVRELRPDLVILDLMLPRIDGWEVCRRIRRQTNVPVIMLTAKAEDLDVILGLELGADDYVTKPFNPRELVARARAVLRRADRRLREERLSFGDLDIDIASYEVRLDGERLDMTPREIELLHYLASHAGRVLTREQILRDVWGYDYAGDARTVDTHVKRLRAKLSRGTGPRNWAITTVWGVGYKFEYTRRGERP